LERWEELQSRKHRKVLENEVFPQYLKESDWFMGKSRILQGVSILHWIPYPLKGLSCGIALLECAYNDGLPERYQVPLAWIPNPDTIGLADVPEPAILAKLHKKGKEGYLVDAFFLKAWQQSLISKLSGNRSLEASGGKLHFNTGKQPLEGHPAELQPKISGDPSHSALEFGDYYYLKIYRKLDDTINPDLEISRYLSEKTGFNNIPAFRGSMTFRKGAQTELALGLLQEKAVYQESGWDYARDAFKRYMEEARTHLKGEVSLTPEGLATIPVTYEDMPQILQEVMESAFPQRMILLGGITADLHASLLNGSEKEGFGSEPFSLHYQRSVYSSFQGLTRSALDQLRKCLPELEGELKADAKQTLKLKSEILKRFSKIYDHRIDAQKIRTHGDYHLEQVLWTGRDFIIRNFEGEPMRPYSERRLRRSPLRDVACMIRSLAYVSLGTLIEENNLEGGIPKEEIQLANLWSHYSARLFLHGYLDSQIIHGLVPENEQDFRMLLEIFMLEKALYELLHEIENHRYLTALPLMGIREILTWGME
jgi:maltose alpha-D-glucosyltransferase/alpha-amylase